jgi:hypothetical protein
MKRASIAAVASLAALAALPAGPASAGLPPGPQHKLPDLVISSFGLSSWGTCAPGKTVATFQVTVKNTGAGAMPSSEVTVLVRDLKAPSWSTGDGETFALAPGASHTFTLAIGYYAQNPSVMTAGAPNPFQAVVNPNHTVQESNYNNNAGPGPATYQGKHVIMVGAPKGCPKGK